MYPDRILYNYWIHSQLSVAKYYWGIVIEWERYVLDYDWCKTETIDWEIRYFPDLVKEKSIVKAKKSKKDKLKVEDISLF